MAKNRLKKEKWIEAGIAALVSDGPAALRAEPLARKLSTTKGSFYWHFEDVPQFHIALREHWRKAALAGILSQLEAQGPVAERLHGFGRAVLQDTAAPAMRAWAQSDEAVAHAVATVDAERLQYISTLLNALGVTNPNFARAAYGALIGMPLLKTQAEDDAFNAYAALIDLVMALR